MEKIISIIKNNRALNIMLNPYGTINRKDFWFGIIMLLIISGIQHSEVFFNSAMASLNYEAYGYGTGNVILLITQANAILGSLFKFTFIPYSFIMLYSSFILALKRSKNALSRPVRWILGLFLYLTFTSISSLLYIQAYANDLRIVTVHTLTTYFYLLPAILLLLGIASIIVLSCLKSEESNSNDNSYGSINFVFKIFVTQIIFSVVVILFVLIYSPLKALDNPLSIIIVALYAIIILYLITQRAIDAGIPAFVPILVVILASTCIGLYIYQIKTASSEISIISLLAPSFIALIFSIINILYIILIALPSKKIEWDDEYSNQ